MTLQETLSQLEALGNEKVRAQNNRNGAGDKQFGVKMGDIRKLADRIKNNPALARELWGTGNMDARLLAILLLKPKDVSSAELTALVQSSGIAQVADWLIAYLLAKHPAHETLRQAWLNSPDSWLARAAWSLTADRITKTPDGLDLPSLLDRLEAEMGSAAPEIQWTMNFALAKTGIHHPALRARALAIGETLGLYRDYPVPKGCTSPFAPIWIAEMVKRQG